VVYAYVFNCEKQDEGMIKVTKSRVYTVYGGKIVRSRKRCRIREAVTIDIPPSSCYNFDIHEPILIISGTHVTEKANNQKMLYFPHLTYMYIVLVRYLAKHGNTKIASFH